MSDFGRTHPDGGTGAPTAPAGEGVRMAPVVTGDAAKRSTPNNKIYRDEALRRYSGPSTRMSRPLVIRRVWFVLLWTLIALLGAAVAGLALIRVPDLTTAPVTVTKYSADPTPHLLVTAQVPSGRAAPKVGDEATVRLARVARPLTCPVVNAGGPVIEVEQLRKRFGSASGPARLVELSCRIAGEELQGVVRGTGEAVIETGTVTAGSLLFGDGT
ncbi:hypothetical protein OG589_34265 [Sphaerisporangium sp. NBC_01403]|uniref:hypothetical protein n=1 Tax=Sphaerisporangium sp. NBC_01403 TaxID=2903599 RepID=UPI003247F778